MPSTGTLRYLEAPAQPVVISGRPGQTAGTLVLLHAFPLNAYMWQPQFALADHGWRVIAPHFRGFDGASSDARSMTMNDYAGDVVDLLDALHVHDAVVGGLSMGGYAALALMRHAPQYVRGLILADTKSQADSPEAKEGREKMIVLLHEKGAAGVASEMLPKLLGPSTQAASPGVVERVGTLIRSNTDAAIEGAIRVLMSREDSTPGLSKIHVPTLIVVGEEDTITPPALSDELHNRIAGSELGRIPKAGHLSSLEQPDTFNALVTRFLSDRV